ARFAGLLLVADRAARRRPGGPPAARDAAAARPRAPSRAGRLPGRGDRSHRRAAGRAAAGPGALMATVDPPFAEFLPDWIAGQRWYTAKGHRPRLRRVGGLRYQDPGGEVGI